MSVLLSAISDGIDWSYGAKLILIVAAAVLLCVAVALLVTEIAGKRKRRVIHADAEPAEVVPEPAEEIAVAAEEPEPGKEPEKEIELTENSQLVDEGEDRGVVVFGEYRFAVRYNRSFTAKLIQSDETLKTRYSELKNELMRYSFKPRMSWSNESIYKGRVTYAKFAIRGKTLSLYLALEPSEYAETKYIYEDAGEVVKYAKTPMRLKLRSDRSVRWAKELIAKLAAKNGLERTQRSEEDFCPEYEETAPLVHRKLIKLFYSGEHHFHEEAPAEEPAEESAETVPAEEQLAEAAEEPVAEPVKDAQD